MITDFCEHFSLSEDPFMQDTIYPAPTQIALLDELEHLLQFGESAVVLIGRSGVGKTTVLRQLAQRLNSEVFILSATEFASLDLLLLTLTEELLLPVADGMSRSAMEALIAGLALEQDPSAAPVILVNRAESLPQGAMLSLLKLAAPDNGRVAIRLVLVCPEGFASDLPAKACPVTPLKLSEAIELLNYKMSEAGFQETAVFSAKQVEPWWHEADGNLNILQDRARQWLIDKASNSEKIPKALSVARLTPIPLAHMVTVAVLVGILGTVYLYRSDSESTPTPTALNIPERVQEPATATDQAQVFSVVEPEAPPEHSPIISSTITEPVDIAVTDVKPEPVAELITASSPPRSGTVAVAEPPSQSLRPVSSRLGHDEQVLLSWPESAYTIQLLAVAARDSAEGFVASHSDMAMLVLKTERSGKPWYVVVTGRYNTADLARRALRDLPDKVKDAKPWPRRVGELQQEIQ